MKKLHSKNIVKYSTTNLPPDNKSDWKRVDKMSAQKLERNALSDKDTILADKKFWEIAKLVMPETINKARITIRIDTDILDWLKKDGRGYQSRINKMLRIYMSAIKSSHSRSR